MDYLPPNTSQFPMPLPSFARGWTAKIFNFHTSLILTNEKENILSYIKSKASVGENLLPFILSHYSAWNVDLKHRCRAAILQTWCCKPEDKGLYWRWKVRKLERDSVSDVSRRHHPSSGLSTSRLIFTWCAIHTHTHAQFFKRRGKDINRNSKIFFLSSDRLCHKGKHPNLATSAK